MTRDCFHVVNTVNDMVSAIPVTHLREGVDADEPEVGSDVPRVPPICTQRPGRHRA